jgi:hypothetical protein
MPLSPFQQRAAELIFNDRAATLVVAKEATRLDPKLKIPELEMDNEIASRVSSAVEPLTKTIEELKTKLDKKEQTESRAAQWALLKGPPYNWPDNKIQELEERMAKDAGDGTVMFGRYDMAAKYYNQMDSPLTPTGNPNMGISRHDRSQDKWRKDIKDPKSPLRRGDRAPDRVAKREYAREEWARAKAEIGR